MSESAEEQALIALCQRYGVPAAQAPVLARQLLKRADQLARERGLSREEAMKHLLQLFIQGSQGRTVPGFEGGPPPGSVV